MFVLLASTSLIKFWLFDIVFVTDAHHKFGVEKSVCGIVFYGFGEHIAVGNVNVSTIGGFNMGISKIECFYLPEHTIDFDGVVNAKRSLKLR